MSGCKKKLAQPCWWNFCGETDMGQTAPVLCTHCGGEYVLMEDVCRQANQEARRLERQ